MERFRSMLQSTRCKAYFFLISVVAGVTFIPACKGHNKNVEQSVEIKPQTPLGVQPVIQPVYSKLPAPTQDQIKQALDRVFQGTVIADDKENPRYIVGDFNGDSSEDLAIWVRPVPERLADINDEFANWTLVDPRKTPVRDPKIRVVRLAAAVTPKPGKIQASELLLAVIHGVYDKGWRDPRARQAYILHQVDGRTLSIRHVDRLPATMHSADVIFPQPNGFLYWAGGAYVWKKSSVARF
jgi:hypothetical protein